MYLYVFIFQIVEFHKILNYSKLVNYYIIILLVINLGNWLIFQIRNFWVR